MKSEGTVDLSHFAADLVRAEEERFMGMFTTIIDPDTKNGIQIKCGYDDMETYHVGQTVRFYHDPKQVGCGYLADDVYLGILGEDEDWLDVWVIIKDHKVHALRPSISLDDPEDRDRDAEYLALREEFDVHGWAHDLWPEEMWQVHYVAKHMRAMKYEEDVAALMQEGKTRQEAAMEMATRAGSAHLKAMMAAPSMAEQILPVTEDGNG